MRMRTRLAGTTQPIARTHLRSYTFFLKVHDRLRDLDGI
jgi:hypothetical protein